MAAPLKGLYAVTPDCADTQRLLAGVEAALAGGVTLVQYRNKPATPELRREQASALLAACRRFGARLIVNDDLALALELGADGVHLGRGDGDGSAARAVLGPDRLLGISCYDDADRARAAVGAGADYLAFGSVFSSPTKPAAVRAPLALITSAKREFGLPVAAIGGITLENASRAIHAGADLLAVITDLFAAPDVTARARAYAGLFAGDGPTPP